MVKSDQSHGTEEDNKEMDLARNVGASNYQQNMTNGEMSDGHASLFALLSGSSGIRSEDIVGKVRAIVAQNMQLKDTITQNNLALRQQLVLFMQWNQQVQQQQDQQREHALEAANQIRELQEENFLLKKNASQRSPEKSVDADNLRSTNERLETLAASQKKASEENKTLKDQRTRLEGDVTLLKCDLSTSKMDLERAQQERNYYALAVKELQNELQKERQRMSAVSEDKFQTASSAVDNDRLVKQLEREQNTTSTLLKELQDSREQIVNIRNELEHTQKQLSESKLKCLRLENESVDTSVSSADLNKKLNDVEHRRLRDEAAMLREEIIALESALSSEKSRSSEERATVSRMHSEIARLKKELVDANEVSERNKLNDHYYQAKLKSVHEQHDEATAKLISYEELLGSKNQEIASLKKEVGELKAKLLDVNSEAETIAVLKAQVEVYQGDFRDEREARERMALEREKLKDEMRHLHARNVQLMDEMENYQRGKLAVPGKGSDIDERGGSPSYHDASWERLSSPADNKEEEPKKVEEINEELLYCPKCSKSFSQLRPLEEHVNRCLDED